MEKFLTKKDNHTAENVTPADRVRNYPKDQHFMQTMAFFSTWHVTSILITPEEKQNWQTFGVCCTRPESAECYRKAIHTQNFARPRHRLKKLRSTRPGYSFRHKIAQSRAITRTINLLSRTIRLQKSTEFSFFFPHPVKRPVRRTGEQWGRCKWKQSFLQVLNNAFHWKTLIFVV